MYHVFLGYMANIQPSPLDISPRLRFGLISLGSGCIFAIYPSIAIHPSKPCMNSCRKSGRTTEKEVQIIAWCMLFLLRMASFIEETCIGFGLCSSNQENIQSDTTEMKGSMADVTTLSSTTKCPMALYRILRDTFQCKICCEVPMKPPVIPMKCYRSIVGCDSCINN